MRFIADKSGLNCPIRIKQGGKINHVNFSVERRINTYADDIKFTKLRVLTALKVTCV